MKWRAKNVFIRSIGSRKPPLQLFHNNRRVWREAGLERGRFGERQVWREAGLESDCIFDCYIVAVEGSHHQ